MFDVRGRDAEAARHHHHQRQLSVAFAVVRGRQEQLAIDRKFRQVGGIADDVEVVGRIGGGNFEILSLALSVGAGGENNVLIAKSQVVVLLRLLFFGDRQR